MVDDAMESVRQLEELLGFVENELRDAPNDSNRGTVRSLLAEAKEHQKVLEERAMVVIDQEGGEEAFNRITDVLDHLDYLEERCQSWSAQSAAGAAGAAVERQPSSTSFTGFQGAGGGEAARPAPGPDARSVDTQPGLESATSSDRGKRSKKDKKDKKQKKPAFVEDNMGADGFPSTQGGFSGDPFSSNPEAQSGGGGGFAAAWGGGGSGEAAAGGWGSAAFGAPAAAPAWGLPQATSAAGAGWASTGGGFGAFDTAAETSHDGDSGHQQQLEPPPPREPEPSLPPPQAPQETIAPRDIEVSRFSGSGTAAKLHIRVPLSEIRDRAVFASQVQQALADATDIPQRRIIIRDIKASA